jgi:hypothetical protein
MFSLAARRTCRRSVLRRQPPRWTTAHAETSSYPLARLVVFDSQSFATNVHKQEELKNTESLKDTVNRLKGDSSSASTNDDSGSATSNSNMLLRKSAEWFSKFSNEVSHTWQELLRAGERKSINKKVPVATAAGDAPYTGPVDIMIIDPSENLTAWERMQKRLSEAPIIQDILTRSEAVYVKSGAADVKRKIDHLSEDAREAWETSQNPWVYRASSVYDTMTAELPESVAVRQLRTLDPNFTLEEWRRDVVEHTLPQIMEWFLAGKINQLKPWLGEGVFKRLAAEIVARQQEGVQIDTHVLSIMNSEILACEVRVCVALFVLWGM